MRNLIQFILKYYFFILFVLLEVLAVSLVIQHNKYHKAYFMNFKHAFEGNLSEKFLNLKDYLNLRKENKQLIVENNKLYNRLAKYKTLRSENQNNSEDSLYMGQYTYIPAKVINNSTNKQYNYITLNKGSRQGIKEEMAVVSADGVVGVVKKVSDNFSSVISVLNRQFYINAKIKKNGYFGPLSWNGKNYKQVILSQIPHHVKVEIGDTIVTSGYSAIYPEGIMIGVVSNFEMKGGNFYEITVDLSTDFKNLSQVQVINNFKKEEQTTLENSAKND